VLTEMFAKALDAARSYKAPSLADVILEAGMPVYVPANSQEDLLLASIGSGSSGSSNVSLTLTFANQPTKDETPSRTEENLIAVRERIMRQRHEKAEGEGRTSTNSAWTPLLPASEADPGAMPVGPKFPPLPTKVLELSYSYEVMEENIDRQEERVDYRFQSGWDDFARQLYSGTSAQVKRQLSEFESKRLCLQTHSILWSVAPDMVDDIAASPTEAVKHRFVIDGKEFSGELLCWAHTYPLCAFRFAHSQSKHVHYLISGTSYGFPMSDAQALLQELVALNDNHALLASYQTQIDEQLQRLLSYYS
jgi:hypothetical protein